MNGFSTHFSLIDTLSRGFSGLLSELEGHSKPHGAFGDTGDPRISAAIETFLEASEASANELQSQLSEVKSLLDATSSGYKAADDHVLSEISKSIVTGAEAGKPGAGH